ncbi:sensor histidine kinase [Georgenia yuyongxinii]|uniref:sensor histidine kinase n=1 Tax=Georgenia yuyongxinii TaxID=2589797 RepID=UPI00163DC081|nr:histidine kinase [Georgenia yuyongxinii]
MAGTVASRRPRRVVDPRVADGAVALALLSWLLLDQAGRAPVPGQRPGDVLAVVLAALLTVPYVLHRRLPLVTAGTVLAALIAYSLRHYAAYPGLSVFVLVLGVALHADRRRSLVVFGASAAALTVSLAVQPPGVTDVSTWVATLLTTVVAWLLGENWRLRRGRVAALQERAVLLEREREERDERAVTAERLRIARELHDNVAHAMSVIAVQAGMGHHVIDTQPAEAKRALAAIESTTRTALVEMRRLLGVLRQEGQGEATLEPPYGLADVPRLVAAAGDGGVRASLQVRGGTRELPAGVNLSAYRIVQEALTNVIKHGGTHARVLLDYTGNELGIEVTDDGAAPGGGIAGSRAGGGGIAGSDDGGDGGGGSDGGDRKGAGGRRGDRLAGGAGHGLIGMRERAAVLGGTFTAGPTPDGGFRVCAHLPLGGPR